MPETLLSQLSSVEGIQWMVLEVEVPKGKDSKKYIGSIEKVINGIGNYSIARTMHSSTNSRLYHLHINKTGENSNA